MTMVCTNEQSAPVSLNVGDAERLVDWWIWGTIPSTVEATITGIIMDILPHSNLLDNNKMAQFGHSGLLCEAFPEKVTWQPFSSAK